MTIETKYGLRHKESGKLLCVHTISNGGGSDCIDISHSLSVSGDRVWYVDAAFIAEYVRNHSTEWYNADYESPTHKFKPEELETVVVETRVETNLVGVELPTFEEYARTISNGNEKDFDFYMWQKSKHPEIHYNLWELKEMLRKKYGKVV